MVLETLSTKKLTILVLSLFLGLIGFFLVGGLIGKSGDEAETGENVMGEGWVLRGAVNKESFFVFFFSSGSIRVTWMRILIVISGCTMIIEKYVYSNQILR